MTEKMMLANADYAAKVVLEHHEAEAWKVAQLAAPILAAWGSDGSPARAVQSAVSLLAEARRQVAARPASEGRADG